MPMKVFISWSLPRSRAVALALKEWLEPVIQTAAFYVSAEDIEKGSMWAAEILTQLDVTNIGIICVTPENMGRPWLSFEAGALAKRIGTARVVPFLFGMTKNDIPADHPFFLFQSTVAQQADVKRMAVDIARGATPPVDLARVQQVADMAWPSFQQQLEAIAADPDLRPHAPVPMRQQGELVEELLSLARSQQRQIGSMKFFVSTLAAGLSASQNAPHVPWSEPVLHFPLHFQALSDLENWVNSAEADKENRENAIREMSKTLDELKEKAKSSNIYNIAFDRSDDGGEGKLGVTYIAEEHENRQAVEY
jgi:hypothetical protein